MRTGRQDQLAAKLRNGRQIAEVIPVNDPRWVLVRFDDGSVYRTTMDQAMQAMQEDLEPQAEAA